MAQNKPPQTIQEEAGLPENWVPVERGPIIPSAPPAAQQQGPGSYFAGPLSPVIQHDAAFYQTKYGGAGIPETALMPPSAATAANNAATSTVVKNILETAAAAASSGGSSSTFTPSLPVNKISAADYTVLIADLAELDSFSNNSGGVITLPAAALLPGTIGNSVIGSGLGSSTSLTGTSTFAGTAISIINTESDLGSPSCVPTGAGWNAIDSAQNGAYASIYSHPVSVAPVTVNYALGTSVSWIDSLTFIWNSTITTVQTRAIFSGGVSGLTSDSATFTNPVAAGNTILVVVTVTAVPYDAVHSTWQYTTIGVSDGVNTYTQTIGATQGSAPGDGIQQVAFIATKVAGGSTTITVTTNTPAGHAVGGVSATAYELNIGNGSPIQSGFPAGWYCYLQNTGSGTFAVQSTALIDGSSSPIMLGSNQGTIVAFDGTNWFTERGIGGSSITFPISVADGGTGTSTPGLVAGSGITITGAWPDQTIAASGGSSIPAGTPVIVPAPRTASDSGFGNQTIVAKIAQEDILVYPTKFKVSVQLQSAASWVMTAGVILRTAHTATSLLAGVGGLTVIDSTPITWGGSATPTLGSGENVSDDINLALDTTHDYWFLAHFSSTSGLIYVSNVTGVVQSPGIGALYYGYVSGDHTADTTMPPSLTTTSGAPVEVLLWRVIAG
jgi:hypothetical protein